MRCWIPTTQSTYSSKVVRNIGGYIVRGTSKQLHCAECTGLLTADRISFLTFIRATVDSLSHSDLGTKHFMLLRLFSVAAPSLAATGSEEESEEVETGRTRVNKAPVRGPERYCFISLVVGVFLCLLRSTSSHCSLSVSLPSPTLPCSNKWSTRVMSHPM